MTSSPDSFDDIEPDVATIALESNGARLDKAVADAIEGLSRSRAKSLIEDGALTLQGRALTDPGFRVTGGEEFTIQIPPAEDDTPEPENIPIDIVYEDDDVIVINKPAGLVVHPAVGNRTGTLVNALLYHCGDTLSGINGVKRPGIVHRLDKDTTGLMIAAKNDHAHAHLAEQLSSRTLSRVYLALTLGIPTPPLGTIAQAIGRHPSNRLKMSSMSRQGREAITHYTVRERFRETLALVECRLETGRTHQIRVHMDHIRHPLIGDTLYGPQPTAVAGSLRRAGYDDAVIETVKNFPRQALHARAIQFIHPSTDEEMSFEADLPDDFSSLISAL